MRVCSSTANARHKFEDKEGLWHPPGHSSSDFTSSNSLIAENATQSLLKATWLSLMFVSRRGEKRYNCVLSTLVSLCADQAIEESLEGSISTWCSLTCTSWHRP